MEWPASEDQPDDQLVIALDFGTTFSGIAYVFANGREQDVISIVDWQGLKGYQQPKVPTVISYTENKKNKFTWGGERHLGDTIEGVKLLLDEEQPRPIYLAPGTMQHDLERVGKQPVDVAADFISAIYSHAIARIESKVPVEYFPAVWSDKAKDATINAAKRAGIYPVTLIKEPEAAAMYTLRTMQDFALSVDDAFVICDAGGGTVDLISYEIVKKEPKLELKELIPGKGGMAGSLGLNRRFEEAVRNIVGEEEFSQLRNTKAFEQARQQFDRSVKRAFRGDPDEEYYINFPMAKLADHPEKNLTANCWNMTGGDVAAIFDPLIADIEGLVHDQVNLARAKRSIVGLENAETIKAIFLVGGFGSSEYLKRRLQKKHPGIQVIQPYGAWAAVVKGAALSKLALQGAVVSNQATRHYGVDSSSSYNEKKDDGEKTWWDAGLGEHRVQKMTWYIHRGDDLKRGQKISFPFFHTLKVGEPTTKLIFKEELMQSEDIIPPRYPSSSTKTNCVLTADLRGVKKHHFKERRGADGLKYLDVHFDLVIRIQSAVMKLSLEIKGKEMGTVAAKYD